MSVDGALGDLCALLIDFDQRLTALTATVNANPPRQQDLNTLTVTDDLTQGATSSVSCLDQGLVPLTATITGLDQRLTALAKTVTVLLERLTAHKDAVTADFQALSKSTMANTNYTTTLHSQYVGLDNRLNELSIQLHNILIPFDQKNQTP